MIAAMDYTEARAAFFSPRAGQTQALDWPTPARRLRDAIEPLATICFWSEPAYDAYAARGLDFLQGYVWGRASALGDAEPTVAAAAFGVFEPGLVAHLVTTGRQACSLDAVRTAKTEGAATALRTVLGDPEAADGLDETTEALRAAAAAAPVVGRPLFAGLSALAWPADPWARLWHACSLLREHRGDSHLAAVVAAGLDGCQANVLTELWVGWEPLAYTGSRAWAPEAMAAATSSLERRGLVADGTITDDGRALRERIEAATDRAEEPVVATLGSDLPAHLARLDAWANRVVEHGWFPPDPYKRASG